MNQSTCCVSVLVLFAAAVYTNAASHFGLQCPKQWRDGVPSTERVFHWACGCSNSSALYGERTNCAGGCYTDVTCACACKKVSKNEGGDSDSLPYRIPKGRDGWCIHEGAVHQDVPGCGRVCSDSSGSRGVKKNGDWPNAPCSACPAAAWKGCPTTPPLEVVLYESFNNDIDVPPPGWKSNAMRLAYLEEKGVRGLQISDDAGTSLLWTSIKTEPGVPYLASFRVRNSFPAEWRGLENAQLVVFSCIEDEFGGVKDFETAVRTNLHEVCPDDLAGRRHHPPPAFFSLAWWLAHSDAIIFSTKPDRTSPSALQRTPITGPC